MRKMKKILAWALLVCMAISLLPALAVSVKAEENGDE